MAVDKPVAVPQKKIGSVDVPNFAGGLFLGGDQNAPVNALVASKDVELDKYGFLIPRRDLVPFLPDTIETTYQKYPVLWNGQLYYFTADNGQIVYAKEGDSGWTACTTVGVAASYTTALTGTNNDLTYTAKALGTGGNAITIAYINPGTASHALVVAVSGNAITVTLATNSSSVITSTGATVLAAIQASTAASALVTVANFTGNTGAGVVTALTATNLTGGAGTNIITTNNGGYPTFIRVLNSVLLLNGTNGDKLAYADLTVTGFPVTKFAPVADPTTALTAANSSGLGSTPLSIYYAYSYEGPAGETLLSPILTQGISLRREQWQSQTTPVFITITFADTPPANAQFRNLYIAVSATEGVISTDDMLQVATGLNLADTAFIDDGSLSINLSSTPPTDNNTDGPRVDHGIVEDGNPILYGDVDNPYNIWIGGSGQNALKFTASNNGYLAVPEEGTNYYPSVVVGFRNGQGVPSLTVLYSNTEGLSKQAVLEQQQVNYGDQTFTVWGTTEQHYGAAGVAAPNSVINYNGKLAFLSTGGFLNATTQPTVQNVLSITTIDGPIDDYVSQIKNSAMPSVVGAGWNGKFMWLVPNSGFDTPQQILVLDTNNKGIDGQGAWDTLDIPANWIGVVSPQTDAAFVYVMEGNKSYKLADNTSTYDTKNGISVPFSTGATGAMIGMGGQVHNEWQADVQVMFNVLQLIGDMTIGVTYRNQNGRLKTKTKKISGPSFAPSGAGGWGDTAWAYSGGGPRWASEPKVDDSKGSATSIDVRKGIQIDDNFNEAQWFYETPVGFNHYKLKAVSYEGIALGVRPDLA